ncbi:protein XRP2, partial [Kipferlia bialata]|eukprot:g12927.t1
MRCIPPPPPTHTHTHSHHRRNQIILRPPGTFQGNECVIDNCHDCTIVCWDHINCVQVDRCTGCVIVLLAVANSVFLTDVSDCRVALACGQYRCRTCTNIDLSLLTRTEPIIESSDAIRVTSFEVALKTDVDHSLIPPFLDACRTALSDANVPRFKNKVFEMFDFAQYNSLKDPSQCHNFTYGSSLDSGLLYSPIVLPSRVLSCDEPVSEAIQVSSLEGEGEAVGGLPPGTETGKRETQVVEGVDTLGIDDLDGITAEIALDMADGSQPCLIRLGLCPVQLPGVHPVGEYTCTDPDG